MPSPSSTIRAFLLTASGYDSGGRYLITLWARGEDGRPIRIVIDDFRPLFFVVRTTLEALTHACVERRPLPMRTMDHQEVDCCYFAAYAAMLDAAQELRRNGVRVLESDCYPVDRYLMERFVKGGFEARGPMLGRNGIVEMHNPVVRGAEAEAPLSVMTVDIENNVATGALYCIGCGGTADICFMVGDGPDNPAVRWCRDEADCLRRFLAHVKDEDPDIILGWNVVDFDLSHLEKRCAANNVPFALGREGTARVVESQRRYTNKVVRISGRVVMDAPFMLRANQQTFEEYSLDFVASELLGEHKSITTTGREKIAHIDHLYASDKAALARYNLDDVRLTRRIFDIAGILPNAVQRTRRSGLLLDRGGGSVASFEYLYLPLLHRKGFVANDVVDVAAPGKPLSGGYVMDTVPGIYRNVLVCDFKSLYPTIIRTFLIDPLGHISRSANRIQGPVGPSFARDETILPEILRELMAARAKARTEKNPYLAQAIKILMNSFYGVLGTQGCRFFSWDLAQTITGTGQFVFKETAAFIEKEFGVRVIYGDTDSLFLLAGPDNPEPDCPDLGRRIVARVNEWLGACLRDRFGAESCLELEFEERFLHFFMPPIRGTDIGSKKRYCGTTMENGSLVLHFKGLESARTDWTEMAREFQHELYLRVFQGKPVEEYIRATVDAVRAGRVDDKLVYRKRLRKHLDEYTVNVPPHAQAAKLLDEPRSMISYFITRDGPQPVEKRAAALDYEHYIDAQIRPIAESILGCVGLTFERIVSGQQELFG